MKSAHSVGVKLVGVAVVFGALLVVPVQSVQAQPEANAVKGVEEITVTAPEITKKRVGTGRHGQPIEVYSTSLEVSYADLDLTKTSDQKTLKDRIYQTAKDACSKVDAAMPGPNISGVMDPCPSEAAREPLRVADAIIAAVNAP
jgi:UrcA family protein